MTCFASQGRTHLDFVYAYAVDVFDRVFVEQRTSGYSRFLSLGVDDINRRYATKDPVTQRFDDFAAFEQRSEEHTSELQSLMRISYAVFCLKKKNQHQTCA